MRKIVTPCPVTSTTTKTVTATASPATVTATAVENVSQFFTVVNTVTSVTTIEATETIVQTSTAVVVETSFSPLTVTGAAKRDVNIRPLPTLPVVKREVKARTTRALTKTTRASTGTCAATTQAPTKVPTYASACSGTVRYSSACSCAGVTSATTTLTPSTVITTSTSTVQYTSTSTVTATLIAVSSVTTSVTTVVGATLVTTDATLIIPTVVTQTSELVIPTTVVVAPAPTCYNFVATNGSRSGQYLQADQPSPNFANYAFVDYVDDPLQASPFTVQSDGKVYGGNNVYGWVTNSQSLFYILQMTDRSFQSYGSVTYLTCSIDNGYTSFPNAVGTLSCERNGQALNLLYCDYTDNDLMQSSDGDQGCTTANLVAVPAASC